MKKNPSPESALPLISQAVLDRLLSGDPWVAYVARRDLVPADPGDLELEKARRASVASPLVAGLVAELRAWPGKPLASHRSAAQAFQRLALAAELGLRRGDPGADGIGKAVMSRRSPEGPFGLPMAISAAHGGSGEETLGWALCDAPVILRALARMGWDEEPALVEAVDHLARLRADRGWPCAVSKSLGGFRGPGKKGDPCPFATLAMLELLHALPAWRDSPEAAAAADCLLGLWENSRVEHPYIFYMGNDFRKLKLPMHWYDLVHVLDALSRLPGIAEDPRLGEMLDLLESKAGPGYLYTPESVYEAWKSWDFGQKKLPSAWLGAVALGILKRAGRVASA